MTKELNYEQETVRSVFGAYINDLKAYSSKPDRPTFRKLEEVRDKAIEALEQGDVLEKIRAEVESKREEVSKKHSEDEGMLNYYFGLNDGLKDARDIIDKYRKGGAE